MAYRFRAKDHAVSEAVRYVAGQQIDGALDAIAKADAAIAVHEVRKCCKKVRALLRLVRPGFPEYARENAAFRDIARLLAGSRDAKVMLDTCDMLIAEAPEGTDPALFAPLRKQLAHEVKHPAGGETAEAHLGEAKAQLKKARERVEGWTPEGEDWDVLGEGLATIMRRARKAQRMVAAEPSAHNYHELRKLMKHHWYHTRLLTPIWPRMMRSRAEELSRLADMLGLHHDICVFEERLGSMLPTIDRFDAVEALMPLAGRRRSQLEREIQPIVARFLAQAPRAQADHWRGLWRIWRAQAHDNDAGDDED